MAITINGTGSITGLTAGGLPDGSVTAADIETSLDLTGKTVTLPSGTGGKVLQVVSTVKTDVFSTNSGAAAPVTITGLNASITPTSTSNKILVMVHLGTVGIDGDSTYGFTLFRDTTAVCIGAADGTRPRMSVGAAHSFSATWRAMQNSISFLDSPSTTSSVTYSLKMGHNGNSGLTMYLGRNARDSNATHDDIRAASTITVMEVAG